MLKIICRNSDHNTILLIFIYYTDIFLLKYGSAELTKKPNAIPTIFGYYVKEKVIEDITNEISYFTSEKDVQDEEVSIK